MSRSVNTEVILKAHVPASSSGSFSAFKHNAFRLYFGGQLVAVSGTWMQAVAQQIFVYEITRSELQLGLVACAQGLPALLLTPFAGVVVERIPRRQILIATQTIMMLLAFIRAALSITDSLQMWHIIALSLGLGFANAIDAPARMAFLVEMVGHKDLPSGIVLTSLMFNVARVIGPAVGGITLAWLGPSLCFLVNGFCFLGVLISLLVMHVESPHRSAIKGAGILRPLRDGFAFARVHPTIGPILLLSALTSTFCLTFSVLFPPIADMMLGDKLFTSALLTAQGIGSLAASLYITRTTNNGHRGRMLVIGAIVAPVGVVLLAFVNGLVLALLLSGIAGFAMVCQFVQSNTLLQTEVPDEYRGRVMSLYTLTFFGLTPFGSLIIGMTAQATGPVTALLIVGGINLVGALFLVARSPQIGKLA